MLPVKEKMQPIINNGNHPITFKNSLMPALKNEFGNFFNQIIVTIHQ